MADVYDRIEVQEGPEVEIGSYDGEVTTDSRSGSEMSDTANQAQPLGFGPEQNIYEVDTILDGPRKRREHNFRVCYKIRWKNFGKEADSWQPLSDLENVMYMVNEYNQQRREQQKKRKIKVEDIRQTTEASEESPPSIKTMDDDEKSTASATDEDAFNPLFGQLKDRFWKKLEMGVLDDQVFEGDMYSKVKGSRRAAHADAALNIKKIQQPSQRSPTIKSKPFSDSFSESRKKKKAGSKSRKLSSAAAARSFSPKGSSSLGSATKSRKRSSDPFSARGYMSAKRSRRSREQKRSTSSVTSVTVGIVSLNSVVNYSVPDTDVSDKSEKAAYELEQMPVEDGSDHRTESYTEASSSITEKCKSDENLSSEAVEPKEGDGDDRMTVTSETMLTVTTEHKRLDPGAVIQPEEIFKMKYDDWFLPDSTSVQETEEDSAVAAAGAETDKSSSSAHGATGWAMRSPMETMAEASGAVEKSHDEECLWGGACNRSDCKSNRRWNMKNGKDQQDNKEQSNKDSLGNPISPRVSSSVSSQESSSTSSPRNSSTHQTSSSSKRSRSSHHQQQEEDGHHLSNIRSLEYDSSFDEPGPSSTDRDAMSTGVMNALAHRMHADTIASSNTSKNSLIANCSNFPTDRTSSSPSTGSTSSFRGENSCSERPGLFSDENSAFNFMKGSSKSSNPSTTTSSVPSNPSSSPGSFNFSSPGKENFRAPSGSNTNSNNASSLSSGYERLQGSSTSSSVQEPVSSSGRVSNPTDIPVPSEGWSHRKRAGETSGPLEKIPSPNSRGGSDLYSRIASITCDELEDMDTQGEDRFVKGAGFITNADLLQAVNLSKAEVVKRAIKQVSDLHQSLDFEQKDNTGSTLLMKAVRRGSVAVVEMLLEQGVDVNNQTGSGVTPLMMACEQKEICLVALLLKFGANSSLSTSDSDQGETALMKAIKKQNRDAVQLMLKTGVNFAAPNCHSTSALDVAVERRNTEIESILRSHIDRLTRTFECKVLETLQDTAQLVDKLFPVQCFPLRESQDFTVKFNCHLNPLATGEGFLLFIAHTKINDKGVKCRFHGSCPIASVVLNGITQTPLTKEVNFVTSCHPIVTGCNSLIISKHPDYTSRAKLMVCAYRAKLLSHI